MAGVVLQGQAATHAYDGSRGGLALCPMVGTVGYTVVLAYAPPTDVLTLAVEGCGSVAGSDGRAQLSFIGGPCARFDVTVHGTSVERAAVYEARVEESREA